MKTLLKQLAEKNIQAGYPLVNDYPELGESLLVCVTETKNTADLAAYYEEIKSIC